MPANTPSVLIRLDLERAPVVTVDALDLGEEDRLLDWIQAQPVYAALVALAYALAAGESA